MNIELDIVRQAWTRGQRAGCRGTPLRSLNFVFIVPIMDSSIFSELLPMLGPFETIKSFSFSCFFKDSFCFLIKKITTTITYIIQHIVPATYLKELIWALATDNCFKLSVISVISSIVSELNTDAILRDRYLIHFSRFQK